MLEFTKFVLERVSIDYFLFVKELNKQVTWTRIEDKEELRKWCENKFGTRFPNEINAAFKFQ